MPQVGSTSQQAPLQLQKFCSIGPTFWQTDCSKNEKGGFMNKEQRNMIFISEATLVNIFTSVIYDCSKAPEPES
jgi:hypothetical protein